MNSARRRTINFAEELRSGRHYGVFIDDSGSPGLSTLGLHKDRKTWAGVIVPPAQVAEVMDQLPSALSYLTQLGLKNPEFHFTDVWSGKGEYSKIDLQSRLAIFRFMAHIFSTYGFKALVQTFDPDNAKEVLAQGDWPANIGPLRTDDHEDLALIILLTRVRQYLQGPACGNATACVVVDEGRLANGRFIVQAGFEPTFCAGGVLFASSKTVHPIQLADFAAFVLNRWQLLRVKEKLSDLDKTLLEILTPLAGTFINIDSVKVHGLNQSNSIRSGMH